MTIPLVITSSIARSETRRYLIYSEADFKVFCPAGATRCTDGVKFGTEATSVPNLTPIGAKIGYRIPKAEIFTEI